MQDLTDVDTFDAAISVPEDGVDLRAAVSVSTGFQQLANRTAYLMNRITDVRRYTFTADAAPDFTAELVGAQLVRVLLIGGGGCGGAVNAVAGRGGGGGGGSGAIVDLWLPSVYFPATPTIVIGAGGIVGDINGDPTSLTGTGLSLSAAGGLGGTTATTSTGAFGGDGGGAYTSAPAQGQGGTPGGGGSGSGGDGGDTNTARVRAGAGGGAGGDDGTTGGDGGASYLGFLGGSGGANNNPGIRGRGYGAGGGGQGRADGGGGGGGGGGIGDTVIAGPTIATTLVPGEGMSGLVHIVIFKGNIGTP